MSANPRAVDWHGEADAEAPAAVTRRALHEDAESTLFVSGAIDRLSSRDFQGWSEMFAARTQERPHASEHATGPLIWISMPLAPAHLTRRIGARLEVADQDAFAINIAPVETRFQAEIGVPHEAFHLFLRPSLLTEVGSELSGKDSAGMALRPVFGESDAGLSALLRTIERTMAEPAEPSRLKIDYLARALSADLLAKYADGSITLRSDHLARGGLSLRQLSRVRDYVEAHLAEDIHVNDLAAIAGVGRTAFTTRFRASTGVTPYQYVMAARVERAKLLLTTARMPLADIAILCGFADQAHFATAFKRRTGRRPLDYRMR